MIYVFVNTRDELEDVHDAWSKKYPQLDRWPNSIIQGVTVPTVLGLVIPGESKYYKNVFYTGYDSLNLKSKALSFDKFSKEYIYKPSKYVKQLKFESFKYFLNEEYIFKKIEEDKRFSITFDKFKDAPFIFLKHNDGIELEKIDIDYDEFYKFFDLLKDDYNGLLGIFLEARKKSNGKKIININKIDWIEHIKTLIKKANDIKISPSKYVKQLKFESFKDFIKE